MSPRFRRLCAPLMLTIALGDGPSQAASAGDTKSPRTISSGKDRDGTAALGAAVRSRAQIQAALKRWEAASRRLEPPTAHQRKNALQLHEGRYSPHELSLAIEFHAPVVLAELAKRFRWTAIRRNGQSVRLVGVPLDHVDRLFFRQFQLTLDAKTHLPQEMHFVQGAGKPRPKPLEFALEESVSKSIRQAGAVAVSNRVVPAAIPAVTVSVNVPTVVHTPSATLNELVGRQQRVDQFLNLWCARLTSISSATAKVSRFLYDVKHQVEFQGVGRLRFRSPNRIRLRIAPRRIKSKDRRSFSFECDGEQALLRDELRGRWVWGAVDRRNPRTISGSIPIFSENLADEPMSLQNLVPIFVGSRFNELNRLYEWRSIRENQTHSWLVAAPKTRDGQGWYRQLKVVVNKATRLPDVVHTIDPSGSFETVYVFRDWKVVPNVVPGK